MTFNSAADIISFMQKMQYRLISIAECKSILKKNKKNEQLKLLFSLIWNNTIPTCNTVNTKYFFSTDFKNDLHPISWFEVSDNISFNFDKQIESRFNSILDLIEKNPSMDLIKRVFRNVQISCEEAKFYLDLFTNCRFGFGYKLLKVCLFGEDFVNFKIKFNKATYVEEIETKSYPVIGQMNVTGFRFKARIMHGDITVIRSDNHEYTDKFKVLKKIAKFLPKNTPVILDFILQPINSDDKWALSKLDQVLCSDEKLKKCNLVILDMYKKGDEAKTLKRLERINHLVDKCTKHGIKRIYCVPYKKLDSKEHVDSFIKRMNDRYGSCIIRKNKLFSDKIYKTVKQFSKNETMIVEDYKLRQEVTPTKLRRYIIDHIVCKDMFGRTIYIKQFSVFKDWLDLNVFNIVGKKVKVNWDRDSSNEPYPVMTKILHSKVLA
jgi:hypothetical protein